MRKIEAERAVPGAIVLYAALGLADFGFTLATIHAGGRELNPFLAWALGVGLFEYLKLALTLLVCAVMLFLWPRSSAARRVTHVANVLMGILLLYHILLWARAMHLLN
ncbi:MAG: hypothetical protein D6724_03945 [Armatimonadetes bacterium]|nr:MAG: hypothetical protein D6724_03945 [Armatimonadota bacterium]